MEERYLKLEKLYLESENEDLFIANAYKNRIAMDYTNKELASDLNKILNTNYGESTLRGKGQFINKGIDFATKDESFNKSVMIINDIHAPFERADLLETITKHSNEIDTLVIGGDFMDCETISSFPKINRSTLTEELIYSYNLMKKIRKILNKNQRIVLINGNHEERLKMLISKMHEKDLQKFINPNILEMLVDGFTIYEDNKKTKYEGIEGITYIPHWYVNIDNKIIVSHPKDFSGVDGKMCEKASEHFLNKHEQFEIVVFAHTHKYSQMKVSRRQGVYVVENGCLCKNHEYSDTGKLGYTPQDYCYTIIKYNNNENINYNNIRVYHLGELETKQDNYKVFI